MMEMVIGGVVLSGIGLGLLYGRHRALDKVRQLQAATLRKAKELQEMAAQVAGEIGAGSYNEQVEVRGRVECDQPLTSELGESPCVYYRFSVVQEYERVEWEQDDETGEERQVTRRERHTVSSNERRVPFRLVDETGSIEVLPDGADMDEERSLSEYRPESALLQPGGGMLSFGGFSFSMGGMHHARDRVLGYRLEEWILPLERHTFVIGEATDSEGRLVVRKPADTSARFIISARSKEALIQSTKKTALIFLVSAIVAMAGGLACVVSGLFGGGAGA